MTGELKPAEALNLADQVEYAEGSVVSRTILQKQVGTLTLFAFDQGQGLSEHSAPFDALVQVLDGEAEIIIGGKPIRTKAGQTVLMPANVPHALQSVSRFKILLTMIRSE